MHPAERRGEEVELDEQLVDERERFRAPQQVREEAPLHGRPEREVVVDVELERDEIILCSRFGLASAVFLLSVEREEVKLNREARSTHVSYTRTIASRTG